MSLNPEQSVNEFFEYFERGENAVQVVPITIKQQSDDTRLMLMVRGEHEAASVIFAEVMSRVDELSALQAQAEAENEHKSGIITS